MIRRPPRSTPKPSSAASDVYKRQDRSDVAHSASPLQNSENWEEPIASRKKDSTVAEAVSGAVEHACPRAIAQLATPCALLCGCCSALQGARIRPRERRWTTSAPCTTRGPRLRRAFALAVATQLVQGAIWAPPGRTILAVPILAVPVSCLLYTSPSPRD